MWVGGYVKILQFLTLICVMFSYDALSCSCGLKSVEESFGDAKAVLLIEVQSLKVVTIPDKSRKDEYRKVLEATFNTIETFKESAIPVESLRTYSNCGLDLYPTQRYLVYVPKESSVENYVSHCHGSFKYRPQLEFAESKLKLVREYAKKE